MTNKGVTISPESGTITIDELQVIPQVLTPAQASALYNGYTAGSSSFDPTHMSRSYFDGLGRPVREATMDLYGHVLTTAQTMGWNDRPTVSFMTTGKYSTNLYSFLGMTEQAVAPAGLASTANVAFYSQREIQTADGDGHVTYTMADVLGRTVQAGVLNPSGSTFNYTLTTYNALGQPTAVDVYAGATKVQGTTSYYYNAAGLLVYEVYPDGTTQTRTYDGDLRLSTVTDPMGRVAANTYVSTSGRPGYKMGWLANVALKNSASATTCYAAVYTYDFLGDVTQIANGTAQTCGSNSLSSTTATVNRYYDSLNRLWKESILVGSTNLTTNESFDAASRVTSITYPQGQGVANYLYDSLGRVRQVNFNNSEYAAVQYDPYGRMFKTWFYQANTNTTEYENYSYDAMNRITAVSVLGATNLMQLVYRYDADSLVTSFSDNMYPGGTSRAKTDTFRYDGNGRLVATSGPVSTKALLSNDDQTGFLNYTYDALGNLLKRQDSDLGTCTSNCLWTSSQTVTYTYTGPYDQLTSTTGAKAESFGYNGLGSMTSRSGWTYTFDFEQQLVKAASTSPAYSYTYSYDGVGRKVKEVDAMASTYTLYYGYLGSTLAYQLNTTGSKGTVFVYLGDTLLFRKDAASTTAHFYATDLSNNVRLVWSYSSGVVVELKQRYKPFGEAAKPLNVPNPDPTRFKFAQQSYSSPTKLYAMGARSYAPDLGRFTSRDPVGGHGYAYAADNPLSFWDPSGKDAIGDFFGWLSNGAQNVASGIGNWWNGLDPNVRGAIILAGVAAAIVLTGGLAAGPLAGMALGSILGTAAVGAAIGAVSSAAIYTGFTLATGGTWSLEGMAQATAIGALITGVTAGAGKAFELWRAGALFAEEGISTAGVEAAADGGELEGAAGVTTNGRVTVIGEDMGRVRAYASEYGGETMPSLPTELPQAEKLALNRAWINARMDEGYTIVDLGPAPSNAYYPYITSPYYAMEQAEIAGSGYAGWLPVWGVFD